MTDPNPSPVRLFESHGRKFAENQYVYPVLSRRAGGISIGINLNLDQACNFDCIYCQVDRSGPCVKKHVEVPRLAAELDAMVQWVTSGQIFAEGRFRDTPPALRRLNDFAFSGDGEPTACPEFPAAVNACAEIRRRHGLDEVKLVLITNATLFDRPHVFQSLAELDANNGEIWAKLDAGTPEYFERIDRTRIPFGRILHNLTEAACRRPIVIQSLFMRVEGQPPSDEELEAYCRRLNAIMAAGGRIKLVQVHTVARRPAESFVAPLDNAAVDALVALVQERTGLPAAGYYAPSGH